MVTYYLQGNPQDYVLNEISMTRWRFCIMSTIKICVFKMTSLYGPHIKLIYLVLKLNYSAWWRHQMETFSVLLALCAGNSLVTCEFSSQRSVTWSFDVYFDLRLNKRLSKQSWGCWFEMPSCSLWRHCNVVKHGQHHNCWCPGPLHHQVISSHGIDCKLGRIGSVMRAEFIHPCPRGGYSLYESYNIYSAILTHLFQVSGKFV